MKYAIFSDVHANLEALEAIIRAYRSESIDAYFCVGDLVGYGADPCQCIEKVREITPVTVAGNHDWASVDLCPIEYFNPHAAKAIEWTRKELDGDAKVFLESLPLTHTEKAFTLVHGSLDNPRGFNYILDAQSAEKTCTRMQTQVCFVGHSHVPGIFMEDAHGRIHYLSETPVIIEREKKYVVNVGSVGQPRDGNPDACYCVFDVQHSELHLKRVSYDLRTARAKIMKAGLPPFLGDRLLSGQ